MTRLFPMIVCIATLTGCDQQSDEPVHEWLQRDNADIAAGNAALDAGDTEGALAAYDRAAASLPSQPGVHLDRGIALLTDGQYATARESLLRATDTPAGSDGLHSVEYFQNVKAAAYYNLGLSFYLEGDATAQGGATPETPGDPEAAQRLFREAITALTRSLQIKPGNRDAAWNLELARRRLREQEEEQERQEQDQENQEQEEEEEDQGDDQEQQDQDQQDSQDGEDGDEPQDGEDGEDEENEGDEEQSDGDETQDGSPEDREQNSESEEGAPDEPQDQEQQNQEPEADPEGRPEQEQRPGQASAEDQLPEDVARALDALQEGEGSFQQERSRARSRNERRLPTKDW